MRAVWWLGVNFPHAFQSYSISSLVVPESSPSAAAVDRRSNRFYGNGIVVNYFPSYNDHVPGKCVQLGLMTS